MKLAKVLIVILLVVSAIALITILRVYTAKEEGIQLVLLERDGLSKKVAERDAQIQDLKKKLKSGERDSYQLRKMKGEYDSLKRENARYKRDMEKAEAAYNTLWDDYQNVKRRYDELSSGSEASSRPML